MLPSLAGLDLSHEVVPTGVGRRGFKRTVENLEGRINSNPDTVISASNLASIRGTLQGVTNTLMWNGRWSQSMNSCVTWSTWCTNS